MTHTQVRRSVRRALLTSIGFLLVMVLLDTFRDFSWPPTLMVALLLGLIEFFRSERKRQRAGRAGRDE